ncbi:MAG: hypothetical protein U5K00_22530 [Melioribacteraceae bacterium]|nr:hypothetical protein [Melioribacteraceae bacterium]
MSLVHGDIRERLSQIQNRELIKFDNRRSLYDWKIQELTSRISSDKIPDITKNLDALIEKLKMVQKVML